MILIDMKLPESCTDCPCSHWITCGPHEGKLMCNVIEQNARNVDKSIVEEWDTHRPDSCPILGEAETECKMLN